MYEFKVNVEQRVKILEIPHFKHQNCIGGDGKHLWTPTSPKLGTWIYLPYSLCYQSWKRRTSRGASEAHITCEGRLEHSPHKTLLFFITTLLREVTVKPLGAKFPSSSAFQRKTLLFHWSAFTDSVCQTIPFLTFNALAWCSHLSFRDCKSP